MISDIKIRHKNPEKQRKILKRIISVQKFLDSIKFVEPFCLILAFTITIPFLKSYSIRWLFGFVALYVATKIVITTVYDAFKLEVDSEQLIQEVEDRIKELKKLSEKQKKEVKA